ncbi:MULTISPECIES: GrpB family protein [unclassified Nostoc]|uniref:GrpB family protein n=1 Tax=unclassified Nostoc TaxID=2593658 RepID=UPI001F55A4B9|nr:MULTISPECIES: GrpB family protein [unclassified Nostoc]
MSSNHFHNFMKVEVVPPNPKWVEEFKAESKQIASVMEKNIISIHHIGSTAIPGIYAKPVIDFLIEVKDIRKVDEHSAAMVAIGYEAMGEFGLPGRRYFRKNSSPGIRTHNVHTYEVGSSEITRHLAFRDYMIAHPDAAQQYSELKRRLAKKYPEDIEGYMDGKDEFIKAMEKKALEWQTQKQQP